jgi:hypothetical protein
VDIDYIKICENKASVLENLIKRVKNIGFSLFVNQLGGVFNSLFEGLMS